MSSQDRLAQENQRIQATQEKDRLLAQKPYVDVADTLIAQGNLEGARNYVTTLAGNGNIDGDSFKWTGKSTHTLTGVSGLSADHASGVAVQEGEFAHVLREICADLAASYYLEDESLFQTTGPEGGLRGIALRERGEKNLTRLAHLGSVDEVF